MNLSSHRIMPREGGAAKSFAVKCLDLLWTEVITQRAGTVEQS